MTQPVEKTMLIDDSEIDLFIQRRFLEVYSFSKQLISCKSARQALDWLRTLNGESPPEVIFLDLNMPEMDGFGFLKSFSELPERIVKKSRIVVLTSSNSSQDKAMALENSSVIKFVMKPLREADIKELQKLL